MWYIIEANMILDPSTIKKRYEIYILRTEDILVNSTGTVGRTRLFYTNCLGECPFVISDSHVSVV